MKFIGILSLTLALALPAVAQTTTLAGKWKITWLQGGTPNELILTEQNGTVAGTYTLNTLGENCPVTGSDANGQVSLHVVCSKWGIDLTGKLSQDEVDGSYSAYGNATGTFKMERMICMLPEGCKN